MSSEPVRLGRISIDFLGSPPGDMKIFHMNMQKWARTLRWDRVFFNAHVHVLL